MLSGDFQRKLRQLNRNLHIYCGDNDKRPASIFHVVHGEFTQICGIDKNWVPQYSIMAADGTHLYGGWRRALRILINKGLVDRKHAEQVFRTRLHYEGRKRQKRRVDTAIGTRLL